MKGITTVNGIVTYEIEPEDDVDRHLIEIMKSRGKVAMRQSSKGGIIFELEKVTGQAKPDESNGPTDLSNVPAKDVKTVKVRE